MRKIKDSSDSDHLGVKLLSSEVDFIVEEC